MVITGALVEAFASGLLVGIIICILIGMAYMLYQERIKDLNRKIERLEDDN